VAASSPPEPGVERNGRAELYCTSISGSAETNTAPIAAPPIDPTPPRTIITRKSIDISRPNESGATRPNASASSAPATPAYTDDSVNAVALVRATSIPAAPAAASPSRIAVIARPTRPVLTPWPIQAATTATTRNRYQRRCSPPNSVPRTAR
jgi:hypothetical protein